MEPSEVHRKTCKRYDTPWRAHYLTFSCFLRRPFLQSQRGPQWTAESVQAARGRGMFLLWGYVFMPEHVHLLIYPNEGVKISTILTELKQPVTRKVIAWCEQNAPEFLKRMEDAHSGKTSHRFWQRGGGYDRNLWSTKEIHEKRHYIHLNPVKRKLVQTVDQWFWSSCRAWTEGVDDPIPIDRESFPMLLP
jgi:putative transposase